MDEKKFSIYDSMKNFWFRIDRVVQDMDIITIVDPVFNYVNATVFPSEESAKRIIKQIDKEGNYDVSNCEIKDINTYEAELQKQEQEKEKELIKAAWENTDAEEKKKIIANITKELEINGKSELMERLNKIGIDTSDIKPNE